MWRLKNCPRCNGDLYMDEDFEGGWFEQCLQCGNRSYMPNLVKVNNQKIKKKSKRGKRARASAKVAG